MVIGFIGCGNLASSLIRGIKGRDQDAIIYVNDINIERSADIIDEYGLVATSFDAVANQSDVLILAVKPNNIKDVLSQLRTQLEGRDKKELLLITVAAGIGLWYYESNLPGIPVIRTMPNTSASVCEAITGLVRGKHVTDEQADMAASIFNCVGSTLFVEDDKINALTAVSGSGPAYFYLIAELMCKAGVKLGLTEEEAFLLANQTLVGAGKMISCGKSPKELRLSVTSPNGTTHEAIESMLEDDIEGIIYNAMEKCANRAAEMEAEFTK